MLDTNNFEYAESRWQDLFLHLKKEGFEVYPPANKTGECKSEYVVVKNDGSNSSNAFSFDNDLYSIMCFVPREKYSSLEPFVQRIKKSMTKLNPLFLPYGLQTPSYYDDTVKAHMVSISYKNYKTNK